MGRRISVTVRANARSPSVAKSAAGDLVVCVREPAREGEANEAVLASLARYFGIPKSKLRIVRGQRSRHKIIECG